MKPNISRTRSGNLASLIIFALGMLPFAAHATIDASTPDTFAESGKAMIESAKSSGEVGMQDLATAEMALGAVIMEAMNYAMDKGGPNVTPEQAKKLAAEVLKHYEGMDCSAFLKEFKRRASNQDVSGTMDPSLAAEWQEAFSQIRRYSVGASDEYLDIYSINEVSDMWNDKKQLGHSIIYQRIKYDPSNLSKPVDFYSLIFPYDNKGKPSGKFFVARNVTLGHFALTGLKKNKERNFKPNGVLPFGQKPGAGFPNNMEIYRPDPEAIDHSNYPTLIEQSLKHRDKLKEWSDVARLNNVEPFSKLFPGEKEYGVAFKWDGSEGTIVSRSYHDASVSVTELEQAEDFLANFKDMLSKVTSIPKTYKQVQSNDKREEESQRDKLFN
jgi:hypothetical protein